MRNLNRTLCESCDADLSNGKYMCHNANSVIKIEDKINQNCKSFREKDPLLNFAVVYDKILLFQMINAKAIRKESEEVKRIDEWTSEERRRDRREYGRRKMEKKKICAQL